MFVSKNQILNQLQLLTLSFFLLLCFSVRGFFATMATLAVRTEQSDWNTITNFLLLQTSLTSFELISLLFSIFASVVILVAFVVTFGLCVKEYRKGPPDPGSISQGRKET
jgi:hypothetical protein